MVKQRRKLAKRRKRHLNKLERRLADIARIRKDKHPKIRNTWLKQRYNQRPRRKKPADCRTAHLLYQTPDPGGSSHGSNSKIRRRRACSKPMVDVRESPALRERENVLCPQRSAEDGFQFDLVDERVDELPVVGVSNPRSKQKPGIRRALTRLSSAKSLNKIQHRQEVSFRADPGNTSNHRVSKLNFAARKEYSWTDHWLVEGDREEDYNARVSRIVQRTGKGRIGVGTMVRVDTPLIPGLMLTCRHCVELTENGAINENLLAFGGPVTVLYVSNKYDLALCEGPPGPAGFRLASEGDEVKGREIHMLSFPWHVDLVYGLLEDVKPTQVHGNVCMFSPPVCEMPMEVDALGTYMGGFPASSGGAVTLSSKVLCGIHVGVIWHDKDEHSMPLVLGSKGHVEPHKNAFHMQLCSKKRKLDNENNGSTTYDKGPLQIPQNFCSSSHGYLATYVSSAHIEEAFQDYLESIRMFESRSERY